MTARVYVGTQGWSYPDWVGPFYPDRAKSSEYLGLYSKAFSSVEVDSSFYAVPPAFHFHGWRERTPDDFRFALKLPGELTHERRLQGGVEVLQTFCRRAALLEEKLGVILIQLPPDFGPSQRATLESFIRRLPGALRFAVEFRDPGWLVPEVMDVLRASRVALALSDGPWVSRERVMETALEPTAAFSYFRWMGGRHGVLRYTHSQIDRSEEIDAWAKVLETLSGQVREIYGFFNNHYEGHSPSSARRLLKRLGLPVKEPEELGPQLSLF